MLSAHRGCPVRRLNHLPGVSIPLGGAPALQGILDGAGAANKKRPQDIAPPLSGVLSCGLCLPALTKVMLLGRGMLSSSARYHRVYTQQIKRSRGRLEPLVL